jgi:hypothetical protein
MSYPTKTIDNNQSLGLPGTVLSVNSDVTFNGKVYCTNVSNSIPGAVLTVDSNINFNGKVYCTNVSNSIPGAVLTVDSNINFNGKVYCTNNLNNLQYGDVTSLQFLVPNITTAYQNTAIGMKTLPSLVSGSSNTGVGSYALYNSTRAIEQQTIFIYVASINNPSAASAVPVFSDRAGGSKSWRRGGYCRGFSRYTEKMADRRMRTYEYL